MGLSLQRGVSEHAGHQGDHHANISKSGSAAGKELGYLGYSRAYGSLPPFPSGARSSKGTAWNWVGPVPGIIFGLLVT